tara:strand:- start:489 stop:1070 length:582 start_codon:yes stop_codon:yes gene_type:complete
MNNKINKLTDAQWDKIWDKYKNLMYSISYRIGGDKICNSIDDSIQELCITAMDACRTYGKKTEKSFEEYVNTIPFNKYIKTCLWNRKNNNGLKIEKKRAINTHATLDENIAETESNVQTDVCPVSALIDDVCLDAELVSVRDVLIQDTSMIKPNGTINVTKLSKFLGRTKQQTQKALAELKTQYKDFEEMNNV